MPTAREFAAAAESFVGVRWRRRSSNPRAGLNCGGLLRASLAAIGIDVADPHDYDAGMPPPELLWRLCREHCEEASWDDQGEGRIGLCAWAAGGAARHLVVMLARRRIVHVDASVRRVTVVPAGWMDSKLLGIFRVRGVEYGPPW